MTRCWRCTVRCRHRSGYASQHLVMLTLWNNATFDAEPISVKDIAALLRMDSATLSPILN